MRLLERLCPKRFEPRHHAPPGVLIGVEVFLVVPHPRDDVGGILCVALVKAIEYVLNADPQPVGKFLLRHCLNLVPDPHPLCCGQGAKVRSDRFVWQFTADDLFRKLRQSRGANQEVRVLRQAPQGPLDFRAFEGHVIAEVHQAHDPRQGVEHTRWRHTPTIGHEPTRDGVVVSLPNGFEHRPNLVPISELHRPVTSAL